MIDFSPLPWGEGGKSSEPGEGVSSHRASQLRNSGLGNLRTRETDLPRYLAFKLRR